MINSLTIKNLPRKNVASEFCLTPSTRIIRNVENRVFTLFPAQQSKVVKLEKVLQD